MRIGPIGEGLRERAAVLLGIGPRPLLETHSTLILSQALMVAAKLGLFEALASSALTPAQVAVRCSTDERATAKLLGVLEATGYVRTVAGNGCALTPDARKWLLPASAHSLHDSLLFRFVEWSWIGGLESFVRSGRPLDIHTGMPASEWALYQRGMRSLASILVREVASRTPLPRGARSMLDLGGSHGLFSGALCDRHPGLHAEILDLPEAVEQAAPMLAREGRGDRVRLRAGDARTDDLGVESFDLVFVSNLLHHFEASESRDVIRRAARALRPGGILVIQELFTPSSIRQDDQVGALADLYFALTSASGTLAVNDLAAWQTEAGLRPMRPVRFAMFPGAGQQNATKPGSPKRERWWGRRHGGCVAGGRRIPMDTIYSPGVEEQVKKSARDLHKTGDDAKKLFDDAVSRGQGAVEEFGANAQAAADRARAYMESARKKVGIATERVTTYADDNTAIVTVAAFGVGLLVGFLVSRKS
ncbi:MAG: methyltransferase domain-containing protein [Holophagales bacterium]|nr:methyltransferase domain-containing protein [Holophagales bacterium]